MQDNNPINCFNSRRMAYFTRNQLLLQPKKLIVLPYMHERKIRINRMKNNCSYFYTAIQEPSHMIDKSLKEKLNLDDSRQKADMIVSMDLTRCKYSIFSMNLLLLNKVNFNDDVNNYGKPVQVSENGKNFLFQD